MSPHQEEVFFELHNNNRREGPGSFESTIKAFTYLSNLPEKPLVLDIGCGPGEQTINLAKISDCVIYAVDCYDTMLNSLKIKAIQNNFIPRIYPLKARMESLRFKKKYFDVIWGEGSIYIMGFENGLKKLKPFLKHNGYIVVSEITWLRPDPPKELYEFWMNNYPAITSTEENIKTIEKCGFLYVRHFTLPESDWLEEYYAPLVAKIPGLLKKYEGDSEAIEVLNLELTEIELYKKYSAYYGYNFYIMQKKLIHRG